MPLRDLGFETMHTDRAPQYPSFNAGSSVRRPSQLVRAEHVSVSDVAASIVVLARAGCRQQLKESCLVLCSLA